jgi:hypothetical protein
MTDCWSARSCRPSTGRMRHHHHQLPLPTTTSSFLLSSSSYSSSPFSLLDSTIHFHFSPFLFSFGKYIFLNLAPINTRFCRHPIGDQQLIFDR